MVGKVFRFIAPVLCIFFSQGFDFIKSARHEIQTKRPIIGIMVQSTQNKSFEYLGKNFIPAGYVKFLESSGARMVPVFNNLTEVETKKLFESINGAVFPRGIVNVSTSGYANISRTILKLAKKTFDEGGYFPIIGMCLGHQILATLVNGPTMIRIRTDSLDMIAPLNLPKNYRDSKLFRDISKNLVKRFNKTLITTHSHTFGLPLELFQENKTLNQFYKVITTNVDRNGVEFVSTMEARKYPFYSTQWHPEKPPFEWNPEKAIPHFSTAIELSQYISNFFVNEARFSKHKFASTKEAKAALIYNYNPMYFAGINEHSTFEQIYLFD